MLMRRHSFVAPPEDTLFAEVLEAALATIRQVFGAAMELSPPLCVSVCLCFVNMIPIHLRHTHEVVVARVHGVGNVGTATPIPKKQILQQCCPVSGVYVRLGG